MYLYIYICMRSGPNNRHRFMQILTIGRRDPGPSYIPFPLSRVPHRILSEPLVDHLRLSDDPCHIESSIVFPIVIRFSYFSYPKSPEPSLPVFELFDSTRRSVPILSINCNRFSFIFPFAKSKTLNEFDLKKKYHIFIFFS